MPLTNTTGAKIATREKLAAMTAKVTSRLPVIAADIALVPRSSSRWR